MRITDARTGQRTEITPRRTGLLRVTVDVGEQGHPFGLGDLRAMLAGDVLLRTCEAQGLQVITELAVPEASDEQAGALLKAAGQLGVHSPAQLAARQEAGTDDRAAADLAITSRSHFHLGPPSTALLVTGQVTAPLDAEPDQRADPLSWVTQSERDPLALRLALLEHAVTAPVRLTADGLAESAATLTRWRALVADLAYEPSRPLDGDLLQASLDGLNEGLDARIALRALHAAEDRADLPAGTVFETFLRLDQILALELGRDIARGPR